MVRLTTALLVRDSLAVLPVAKLFGSNDTEAIVFGSFRQFHVCSWHNHVDGKEQADQAQKQKTALPAALVSGRVDGISNYIISQPLLSTMAATENKKVRYLAFSDYGVDAYAQALTTSENLISTNRDQVKRVARAIIRGLKGTIDYPEEAAEIIHSYHREIEVPIAEGEIKIVGELAELPGIKIGTIQSSRMEKTIELVKQTITLKSPVKPQDVYDQVL
jgi:ABC-type nitrate/sulfonate/bicarbonate transport system substrate-binding protein